jgi:hypothetical protein
MFFVSAMLLLSPPFLFVMVVMVLMRHATLIRPNYLRQIKSI